MTNSFSRKKKLTVYEKYSGKCAYCGDNLSIENMHIDHIYPKALGGSNGINNLNASCIYCNTTKGNKTLEEYRLHMMIKNSEFSGIINGRQWQEISDRGVFINLPIYLFHFEAN